MTDQVISNKVKCAFYISLNIELLIFKCYQYLLHNYDTDIGYKLWNMVVTFLSLLIISYYKYYNYEINHIGIVLCSFYVSSYIPDIQYKELIIISCVYNAFVNIIIMEIIDYDTVILYIYNWLLCIVLIMYCIYDINKQIDNLTYDEYLDVVKYKLETNLLVCLGMAVCSLFTCSVKKIYVDLAIVIIIILSNSLIYVDDV